MLHTVLWVIKYSLNLQIHVPLAQPISFSMEHQLVWNVPRVPTKHSVQLKLIFALGTQQIILVQPFLQRVTVPLNSKFTMRLLRFANHAHLISSSMGNQPVFHVKRLQLLIVRLKKIFANWALTRKLVQPSQPRHFVFLFSNSMMENQPVLNAKMQQKLNALPKPLFAPSIQKLKNA